MLEAELCNWMISLFNGNKETCGTFTSGGTESIFVGVFTLK